MSTRPSRDSPPVPRGRRHRQRGPRGGLETGRRPRHGRQHIQVARSIYYRPAPSAAVPWSGRKPYTPTPAYSGSPPSISTSPVKERSSGSGTTASWTSSRSATASASCVTPRPPSHRASVPGTAGSPTTWRRSYPKCRMKPLQRGTGSGRPRVTSGLAAG